MEYEWKILFESMNSMNAPGYTSEEISVLLTQAEYEMVIEVAQNASDSNDYARMVLGKLLTPYSSLTIAESVTLFGENAYRITLPTGLENPTPLPEFFYPFIEFALTNSDGALTAFTQSATFTSGSPTVTFGGNLTVLANGFIQVESVVYKVLTGTTTNTITLTTNYTGTTKTITSATGTAGTFKPNSRGVKPIDYNSYYTSISNPFAKPYVDLYWRVYENGYLTIITDGTVLTDVKGLYIKKPPPIITAAGITIDGISVATDCVLHDIVHREIVRKAVRLAMAAMKDQAGYQIQNIEENQ